MPWEKPPEGWGSPHNPGHSDDTVYAVIKVLDKWLTAMESGEAEFWFPDPSYPKRWSAEDLERIIAAIDEETDKELSWAKTNQKMRKDAGPGYLRLKPAQRLAFVQELHTVLAASPEVESKQAPPSEEADWAGWYPPIR